MRAAFKCSGILGHAIVAVLRASAGDFLSRPDRNIAKAGGESRLYSRDDMRKLANIRFEIGTPDNQASQILQSADAGGSWNMAHSGKFAEKISGLQSRQDRFIWLHPAV